MRLSEAIRLGALLRPQGFGEAYTLRAGRVVSCAMGAASEAIGDEASAPSIEGDGDLLAYAEWPWIESDRGRCPAGCRTDHRATVADVIPHLNDEHYWTRERIADWVATVEPVEPSTRAEPVRQPEPIRSATPA